MACCAKGSAADAKSAEVTPRVRGVGIPHTQYPDGGLRKVIEVATGEGVPVFKLGSDGKTVKAKRLVLDHRLQFVTFLPSNKSFHLRQIPLSDVVELRPAGAEEELLLPYYTSRDEKKKLRTGAGLIIGLANETELCVVFENPADRPIVIHMLAYAVRRQKTLLDESPHRVRLLELWLQADVEAQGRLDFSSLVSILHAMMVRIDRATLRRQFDDHDLDRSDTLDFEQFASFFEALTVQPQLRSLFDTFAAIGGDAFVMEPNELVEFLHKCQGESVSEKAAAAMCVAMSDRGEPFMSFNEFCRFLLSPLHNGITKPTHTAPFEPMDRPFYKYSIATASARAVGEGVDCVLTLLRNGFRCLHVAVEKDHDDLPVVVKHRGTSVAPTPRGITVTNRLVLEDVLAAVMDHGFDTNPYPILIIFDGPVSLASATFKIASSILGGRAIRMNELIAMESRPTPESLKGRVLLGSRWGSAGQRSAGGGAALESQRFVLDQFSREAGIFRSTSRRTWALNTVVLYDFETAASEVQRSQSLKKMINVAEVPASRLDTEEARLLANAGFLLSVIDDSDEYSFEQHVTNKPRSRLRDAIRKGANLAATLGPQDVPGDVEWMNAHFYLNGGVGYRAVKNPDVVTPTPEGSTIAIRVLLGSQLPQAPVSASVDVIDPFVELSIEGHPSDVALNGGRGWFTPYVHDNGFNPVWNCKAQLKVQHAPHLADLRVRLFDYHSGNPLLVAYGYVPLKSIRQGYRAVELRSALSGQMMAYSTVLIHIAFKKGIDNGDRATTRRAETEPYAAGDAVTAAAVPEEL